MVLIITLEAQKRLPDMQSWCNNNDKDEKNWCVLPQITINKLQFILYKHKDKYLKCVGTNHK